MVLRPAKCRYEYESHEFISSRIRGLVEDCLVRYLSQMTIGGLLSKSLRVRNSQVAPRLPPSYQCTGVVINQIMKADELHARNQGGK